MDKEFEIIEFNENKPEKVAEAQEIKEEPVLENKNSQKVVLSDLKTNDYFWSNVVFDENYVVVYSRGCMVNQIPLNIEAAYDIKEERLLDLSYKKLKVILEYNA